MSKTCGRCGTLNDVKGARIYNCKCCKLISNRDFNGARNIFIKTINDTQNILNKREITLNIKNDAALGVSIVAHQSLGV